MPPTKQDPAVRYLAKVDERGPDDCWPWTASCHKNGYGQFFDGTRMTTAHRFGFLLRGGKLAPGECVLHKCDNPPCQNPTHWFAGTQRDNAEDREQKQRGNHPQGERSGHARLSEQDVVEIRKRYQTGEHAQAIADAYGLASLSYVYMIVKGQKWKHLPVLPVTRRRNGNARLTDDEVREIRRARANGVTLHVLSQRFNTTMSNVSHIALRRSRADVPDLPEDHPSGP
jgi:hypothetical protein